jgi:hypothetical protein
MYEDENENDEYADFLANLDAIAANFQTLRRSYPFLSQQVRDQGLTYVNCPLLDTPPVLMHADSSDSYARVRAASDCCCSDLPPIRSDLPPITPQLAIANLLL